MMNTNNKFIFLQYANYIKSNHRLVYYKNNQVPKEVLFCIHPNKVIKMIVIRFYYIKTFVLGGIFVLIIFSRSEQKLF